CSSDLHIVVVVVAGRQDVVAGLVPDRALNDVPFPGQRHPAEAVGSADRDAVAEACYAGDVEDRLDAVAAWGVDRVAVPDDGLDSAHDLLRLRIAGDDQVAGQESRRRGRPR